MAQFLPGGLIYEITKVDIVCAWLNTFANHSIKTTVFLKRLYFDTHSSGKAPPYYVTFYVANRVI